MQLQHSQVTAARVSGELVHSLWYAASVAAIAATRTLAPLRLNLEEHAALASVAGQAATLEPARLATLLLALEERGLVRRRWPGAALTARGVELTERGEALLDAASARLDALEQRVLADCDDLYDGSVGRGVARLAAAKWG